MSLDQERRIRWVNPIVFFLLGFLSSSCLQAQESPNQETGKGISVRERPKPEIVVEEVTKNSEGEKSGIQAGDILRRWSRGDAGGELESPFDLPTVEMEQAPRGQVSLEGTRAGESKNWKLGQDTWGIKVRVALPEGLAAIDGEGSKLAMAGKP